MRYQCRVSSLLRFSAGLACASLAGCGDDGAGTSTPGSTSAASGTSSGPDASSTDGVTGDVTAAPTDTGGAATETPATSGAAETGSSTGDGTTGSSTTGADACADSVLTWENFGEPFMLSWCTGCHHSELPSSERACAPCYVNFDKHAGVQPLAAYIELRVIDWAQQEGVKPMPPAAIIPEDQLTLLREYLDCGAPGPDDGGMAVSCPDPETVPDCP